MNGSTDQLPMHEPIDDAVIDLMAEEVVMTLRRGETPNVRELAVRYPHLSGSVEQYVRSLTLLEASSSKHHGPTLAVRSGDPFSRTLGDFRLIRELGRGGMGIVYEAEQVSLNRRVAIKILPHSPLFSERASARFVREATAAARLHHSHIVPVFGLGEQDGLRYFVMQCIRGPGLDVVIPEVARLLGGAAPGTSEVGSDSNPARMRDAVRAAERLVAPPSATEPTARSSPAGSPASDDRTNPAMSAHAVRESAAEQGGSWPSAQHYWKNVARIGLQAAEALAYAHEHDVLHRDLKPANLLLDERGQVWLTDFGLAKCVEEEALTESGDLVGTVRYSPPESFRGTYDARSDLYQLGLTLYELMTFRPAVLATNRHQAIEAVLHERPEQPRRLRPDIPRDLETIVMKCLADEPGSRYASAGLLADDLRRFLQDRPIQARRVRVLERTWRWCRRNRAVAALAGLSAGMLLLIAVVSSVAFLREARLRREADQTTETALQALDHVYAAFVPGWSTVGEAAESGPLKASPEVAQLLEELVQFYDRLAGEHGREAQPQAVPDAVKALRRVGQIYVRLGLFDQAKETYGRAVQRLATMRSSSDPEVVLERARVFNDLGIVYWVNRQIEESYESHLVAQDLLDRRAADGSVADDDEWQFELARTWYLLVRQGRGRFGGVPLRPVIKRSDEDFDRRERTPQRSEVLGKAVQLLESLAARSGNPEHRHLLAICYREGAVPGLEQDGRTEDESITRAIEILEQLVSEHPGHLGYRYSLCVTYQWYNIPQGRGEAALAAGIERSDRALALAEQLAEEIPQEWIFRAVQVDINLQSAKFLNSFGHEPESLRRCREAVHMCNALHEQYPSPAFDYWLGHIHLIIGEILSRQAEHDSALKPYNRSVELLSQAVDDYPEGGHVIYGDLRRAAAGKAAALEHLHHTADATQALLQADEYKQRHQLALAAEK